MTLKYQRAALITLVVLLALPYCLFVVRSAELHGQTDIQQFYFAAKLICSGHVSQLYDPNAYQPMITALRNQGAAMSPYGSYYFNRPALQAIFYLPVAWFSYRHVLAILLVANLALIGFLVWKLPIWFSISPRTSPFLRVELAVFYPFLWTTVMGQDTLLLTALLAYALTRYGRGDETSSGILFGLCAWKPHLTFLVPFAFLLSRKLRIAFISLATSSAYMLSSLALVGVNGFRQWLLLLGSPFTDVEPRTMPNLRGLDLLAGRPVAIVVGIVVVACLITILFRGPLQARFAAALPAALLFSPHTYSQDYSIMAISAMLLPNPAIALIVLVPWMFFYRGELNNLALIPLALVCLIYLAMSRSPLALTAQEPGSASRKLHPR